MAEKTDSKNPNRPKSLIEVAKIAIPPTILFIIAAWFLTAPPEAKLEAWKVARNLSKFPIARGVDGSVQPMVEFLSDFDPKIERLSKKYGVPKGAMVELLHRELGSDDSDGFLGLKNLTSQRIKWGIEKSLVESGLYPENDPRFDKPIGPALGLTNLHPNLIDKRVISAIQNKVLRERLERGLVSDQGHVDVKYLGRMLSRFSDKKSFTVELELNYAIISALRGPVDKYVAEKGVDQRTAEGLLSLLPFSVHGESGGIGVGQYGISLP